MNLIRELKRTWIHQTGIHLATLSVFSFTVAFMSGSFLFLKNTSNLVQSWGDQHQISVYFKSETQKKSIQDFVDKIKKRKEIKKYLSLIFILKVVGWSLIILLFIMSFFVISNSIRVSINSRRYDIEIFELVGSGQSDIRRPFLVEGFILGFLGGVIGLSISYFSYVWVLELIEGQEEFSNLRIYLSFLSLQTVILFVFVSFLLGRVSSDLCVRRINDGWAARN